MSDQPESPEAFALRLGQALVPTDEISRILEVDPRALQAELKTGATPMARAIVKGRLLTAVAWREAVITQALNGSSPAQQLVADLLKRTAT